MKRKRIKPISKKREKSNREDYLPLVHKLRLLANNCSELSGDAPDWQSGFQLDPHHITGRTGKKLVDPFNIIMLTRTEHEHFQKHMTRENKEYLLAFIKSVRLKQGFKEE